MNNQRFLIKFYVYLFVATLLCSIWFIAYPIFLQSSIELAVAGMGALILATRCTIRATGCYLENLIDWVEMRVVLNKLNLALILLFVAVLSKEPKPTRPSDVSFSYTYNQWRRNYIKDYGIAEIVAQARQLNLPGLCDVDEMRQRLIVRALRSIWDTSTV